MSLKIKLIHPDSFTVFNEEGVMVSIYSEENGLEEFPMDDVSSMVGFWHKDTKRTELWEDILPRIKEGSYELDETYLHNGQVIDEGKIIGIELITEVETFKTVKESVRRVGDEDMDFFTNEVGGNNELTYIIVVESIGERKKTFRHFNEESYVITEIARITNDKHNRIHKIMIMNERGETKELKVDFTNGKLRLTIKEGK
jgi:hypothetical protein